MSPRALCYIIAPTLLLACVADVDDHPDEEVGVAQQNLTASSSSSSGSGGSGAGASGAGAGGTECAEERDYYPWYSPAPWKDCLVLTWTETTCHINCEFGGYATIDVGSKHACSCDNFAVGKACHDETNGWCSSTYAETKRCGPKSCSEL